LVKLDTSRIKDWDTFHDVFAETFGFPDFYGRNMNAWIDCMTYLDDPLAGMSSVHAQPHETLVLQLEDVDSLAARCPELYSAIIECSAFVNWRRIEMGGYAVLALSFHKSN
jgi:RNAse (barnase) inhibitor barstar